VGLDLTAIAAELGALVVKLKLNRPRHWVIDGVGLKVNTVEPVLRDFNGLLMCRLALIDMRRASTEVISTRWTNAGWVRPNTRESPVPIMKSLRDETERGSSTLGRVAARRSTEGLRNYDNH
jgi:hypothetical protein